MNAKIIPVLIILTSLLLLGSKALKYDIGDIVDNFKLKNVDGKIVSLEDYKSSKGVIVIFDCNTCPYSKAYNERILDLHQKYSGKGFPVVVINANDPEKSPGDSFKEMVSHAKSKKYTFPYLVDESQEVANAFGATNTPHVFVLKNNNDNFTVAYIGAIDDSPKSPSGANKKYVEDAVNALIEGKSIETTKTKAIGCTIKWKNS